MSAYFLFFFGQVRARKALMAAPSSGLERAVNWMLEHGDDDGIDGSNLNTTWAR